MGGRPRHEPAVNDGLSTIVEMDHPETGINLTYISQTGSTGGGRGSVYRCPRPNGSCSTPTGSTGAARDQFTGLHPFGRVIDQNWYDTTTDTSVVNLQYSYDEDGNVVWRINGVNSSMGAL